jgi:hypothetical protein
MKSSTVTIEYENYIFEILIKSLEIEQQASSPYIATYHTQQIVLPGGGPPKQYVTITGEILSEQLRPDPSKSIPLEPPIINELQECYLPN